MNGRVEWGGVEEEVGGVGRDYKVSLLPSSRHHAKSAHAGCRKQAAHELSLPEDQRQESELLNSRIRNER